MIGHVGSRWDRQIRRRDVAGSAQMLVNEDFDLRLGARIRLTCCLVRADKTLCICQRDVYQNK